MGLVGIGVGLSWRPNWMKLGKWGFLWRFELYDGIICFKNAFLSGMNDSDLRECMIQISEECMTRISEECMTQISEECHWLIIHFFAWYIPYFMSLLSSHIYRLTLIPIKSK